jgi:hypothetical protein
VTATGRVLVTPVLEVSEIAANCAFLDSYEICSEKTHDGITNSLSVWF